MLIVFAIPRSTSSSFGRRFEVILKTAISPISQGHWRFPVLGNFVIIKTPAIKCLRSQIVLLIQTKLPVIFNDVNVSYQPTWKGATIPYRFPNNSQMLSIHAGSTQFAYSLLVMETGEYAFNYWGESSEKYGLINQRAQSTMNSFPQKKKYHKSKTKRFLLQRLQLQK